MTCYLSRALYVCGTASDLPSSGLFPGDRALVLDTQVRMVVWAGQTWSELVSGGGHTPPCSNLASHASATAPHSGHAATTHNHAANTIDSGTLDGDRLPALSQAKRGGVPPTGTPSGNYLKDDGTWAAPTGAGGLGYAINGGAANQATTTDSQTMYWGSILALAPTTTAGNTRIYIPKAGTIKAAVVFAHAATAGSGESWVMNIRLNNTTDTQIAALASTAAQRLWAKYDLSIAVAAGDYIEIKEVQPLWATNPANVRRACTIYVE